MNWWHFWFYHKFSTVKKKIYVSVWVIIGQFTKMIYFILGHKIITDTKLPNLIFQKIVCLHWLPHFIILDCYSTFTPQFETTLCYSFKVKQKVSIGFGSQIEWQTEYINRTLEKYLQAYINYQKNNWETLLLLCKFAYNNLRHSNINISLFFVNCQFHPKYNILSIYYFDIDGIY